MKPEVVYGRHDPYTPDTAYIGIKICEEPYVACTFRLDDKVPKMTLFCLENIIVFDKDTAERHFTFLKAEKDRWDSH